MSTPGSVPFQPRAWLRCGERALSLLSLLGALAAPASAQLIPIRTVPIAQGDQFLIFPSNNLGMGGVSIALADSLLDPFRNPAKGAWLGAARFLSAPTIYSISQGAGAGRTLPLAALMRAGSWFGGLSLALQEVDASRPIPSPNIFAFPRGGPALDVSGVGPGEQSHGNAYAFASLGKVVPPTELALGGSVLWARLHAQDGVDLLYPGSERITQSGHALDLRLGLLKQWSGDRSLEALILHHRFRMSHDVTYLDLFWDPATQQFVQLARVEHGLDRTNTSGLHLAYRRPLAASGWRIGWLATANRLSHPGLPADELMNIPRDRGHSSAYNVGLGLSKTSGPATFAIDAVYEPIWSTTRAVATAPVGTALGDTIPAGGETVVNRFRFSNAVLRMGVSRDLDLSGLGKAAGFELGVAVRAIHYRLAQDDHVEAAARRLTEGWLEWTPTWGLSLRFTQFELRYRGRVTNGMGRPGVVPIGPVPLAEGRVLAPGVLVAPAGSLDLAGVSTVMHQVSLSLPLR